MGAMSFPRCFASILVVVAVATAGCSGDDGRSDPGDGGPGPDGGITMPDAGDTDAGPASCMDGTRNQDETSIDCGGAACPPCPVGQRCNEDSDCVEGVCGGVICAAPSCEDGIQNGDELGVDCGAGGDCIGCPGGTECTEADHCLSRICEDDGTCADTSCMDMLHNAGESDVDCGGPLCPGCDGGGMCDTDEDCRSLICQPDGTCTEPTCTDMVQNQGESDVDCGGMHCDPCEPGRTCGGGSDCESLVCDSGSCVEATCEDGVQNADETDVDCGGGTCDGCGDGLMCMEAGDCASGVCDMGACAAPTCSDGVRNGGETDVDCGGSTSCDRCPDFRLCTDASDCTSDTCTMGICGDTGCMPFPGGGTDTFGYFACSVTVPVSSLPCPDVRSSSTATATSLGDDGTMTVPIGFSFDFYGTSYTMATISANGVLAMGSASYVTFSNSCLPYTGTPSDFIAAHWDDLYPGRSGSGVWYETLGSAPSRTFVVHWDTEHISSSTSRGDIRLVLHEGSGDIDVCYVDTDFGSASYDGGASATIGIQGPDHLELSCNTASLSDGMWVQYHHP